jgi:ribosomal protein S18 acetylase RimI-like enzyme
MTYEIIYENNPNSADIQLLNDGIILEHKRKKYNEPLDFFSFLIRDNDRKIVAGCAGDNMYGGLFVGQLWVTEPLRGKGYGTQLMLKVNVLAKERKCNFITVNTFNWEAPEFYKKLGFYVEFERKGFNQNSVFCFLRKDLT